MYRDTESTNRITKDHYSIYETFKTRTLHQGNTK